VSVPTSALPSSAVPAATWETAHAALVATVRDLIRIPSVNPVPADAPDGETRVARYLADRLSAIGLQPEIVEPVPGRGSVHVHLIGDGTGGEPFLLFSHLDVVPAPPDRWTHDPFAADVADGYIYGRGAVDMKGMVALELAVVERLVAEARDAGLDPARDPIPGLRRDLLFTCTADEEAGGEVGARWLAANRPDWLQAAGALNECGGVSVTVAGRRLYPIQVAEKGFIPFRIKISGTWGHGSMPRDDNAALLAARAVERLSRPGPIRLTPVMTRFLEGAAAALPPGPAAALRQIAAGDADADAAIDAVCEPMYGRALHALIRDTLSIGVIDAGVKYNVVPGEAILEVDCRVLPGTTAAEMRAEVEARLGPDLLPACEIEPMYWGEPVESPADGQLYELLAATLVDHDPEAVPLPVMTPFATDAKSTVPLGVPTYGFSPFRLAPDEPFLERFHGVDERLSLEALRFGLPVLYDVVRRFCG
jgi:acetylornithine deacetylase/succinyl-diaminopimelate desuccinylase-like protein